MTIQTDQVADELEALAYHRGAPCPVADHGHNIPTTPGPWMDRRRTVAHGTSIGQPCSGGRQLVHVDPLTALVVGALEQGKGEE